MKERPTYEEGRRTGGAKMRTTGSGMKKVGDNVYVRAALVIAIEPIKRFGRLKGSLVTLGNDDGEMDFIHTNWNPDQVAESVNRAEKRGYLCEQQS